MADPDLHAPGRFCWVDLSTLDLERARRFYTSVFDWETVEVETGDAPPYLMFTQDDKIVAGLSELDDDLKKQGIPATWNHYVAVENADETAERVEELGGSMVVPVMQVLSAGRLGFLTDPTGAALGIWEAEEHGGFEIVTEANSVCWHELATRDLAGATEFFEDLFGWATVDNPVAPAGYRTIKLGHDDLGGILQMTEEWGDMPPHWTVYFAVEDADGISEQIEKAGGTVHHGPFDTPIGRLAVCGDDQGAHFHVLALQTPA
jgi:predicted enzyme related to lactoylglutathione lyase